MPLPFGVELAAFAESGVLGFSGGTGACFYRFFLCRSYFYEFCVGKPERELVSVEHQLYRVTHGRVFQHRYLSTGDYSHIEEMLSQRALSVYRDDPDGLADLCIF